MGEDLFLQNRNEFHSGKEGEFPFIETYFENVRTFLPYSDNEPVKGGKPQEYEIQIIEPESSNRKGFGYIAAERLRQEELRKTVDAVFEEFSPENIKQMIDDESILDSRNEKFQEMIRRYPDLSYWISLFEQKGFLDKNKIRNVLVSSYMYRRIADSIFDTARSVTERSLFLELLYNRYISSLINQINNEDVDIQSFELVIKTLDFFSVPMVLPFSECIDDQTANLESMRRFSYRLDHFLLLKHIFYNYKYNPSRFKDGDTDNVIKWILEEREKKWRAFYDWFNSGDSELVRLIHNSVPFLVVRIKNFKPVTPGKDPSSLLDEIGITVYNIESVSPQVTQFANYSVLRSDVKFGDARVAGFLLRKIGYNAHIYTFRGFNGFSWEVQQPFIPEDKKEEDLHESTISRSELGHLPVIPSIYYPIVSRFLGRMLHKHMPNEVLEDPIVSSTSLLIMPWVLSLSGIKIDPEQLKKSISQFSPIDKYMTSLSLFLFYLSNFRNARGINAVAKTTGLLPRTPNRWMRSTSYSFRISALIAYLSKKYLQK